MLRDGREKKSSVRASMQAVGKQYRAFGSESASAEVSVLSRFREIFLQDQPFRRFRVFHRR
jgi:hypothetical protein